MAAPVHSTGLRFGFLPSCLVVLGCYLTFQSFHSLDTHLVVAQVGGQVELHGMPGGGTTPSWVRLSRSARKGQRVLQVQGAVASKWPPGASLALASTDFFPSHAEQLTIASGESLLLLVISSCEKPLCPWGEPWCLRGVPGSFAAAPRDWNPRCRWAFAKRGRSRQSAGDVPKTAGWF